MTDIITQAREYVASRGTTAQPRAFDLARALVALVDQQPAAQPDMAQVPREPLPIDLVRQQSDDHGLWFEASTAHEAYLQDALRLLHAAVEVAAAPQQPAAQPSLSELTDRLQGVPDTSGKGAREPTAQIDPAEIMRLADEYGEAMYYKGLNMEHKTTEARAALARAVGEVK